MAFAASNDSIDHAFEQNARAVLRLQDSSRHVAAQRGDVLLKFKSYLLQFGLGGHLHPKCGDLGPELVFGDHLTTDGRKLVPHLDPELHNLQLDGAHADFEPCGPVGEIAQRLHGFFSDGSIVARLEQPTRGGSRRFGRTAYTTRMASNRSSPVVTGWAARFGCSIAGIAVMFRSQDSARIQAIAAAAVVALGLALQVSTAEWSALVLAIALVLIAEGLNTSIEAVVDLVSPEFHELAGRAKDVGAGAVLIAAVASAAIGLLVFGPHLRAILHG